MSNSKYLPTKILTLSDLHFGKWGDFGIDAVDSAKLVANHLGADVLDHAPKEINGINFVGSLGWFNGTLWTKPDGDGGEYPPTNQEAAHSQLQMRSPNLVEHPGGQRVWQGTM